MSAFSHLNLSHHVAHDLKSPLRSIKSFHALFLETLDIPFTEDQQCYLSYIEKSIQQLENRVNSLNLVANIVENSGHATTTDLNESLHYAKDSLQDLILARDATITSDFLPTLLFQPSFMHDVFFHLLRNSLTFCSAERKPIIAITAEHLADGWTISISDNGIGIDSEYYELIFQLFYRLEPQLYDTVGAGLSLCRTMLESAGASITPQAPSDNQEGITFILCFPNSLTANSA